MRGWLCCSCSCSYCWPIYSNKLWILDSDMSCHNEIASTHGFVCRQGRVRVTEGSFWIRFDALGSQSCKRFYLLLENKDRREAVVSFTVNHGLVFICLLSFGQLSCSTHVGLMNSFIRSQRLLHPVCIYDFSKLACILSQRASQCEYEVNLLTNKQALTLYVHVLQDAMICGTPQIHELDHGQQWMPFWNKTMDAILNPANGYVNDKNELTFKVLFEVSDWLEMKFSMTWAPKSSKSFLYCCLYLIRFVLLCYQKSTSVLVSTNNDAHRKTCFKCCHIQYCKLTRCVLVLVYKVHYSAAPINTSSNCGVGNLMLHLTLFLALQVSAGTDIACLWTLFSSVTQAPHIASYYKVRTYVGKYLRSSVRSSIMTLVKTSQPCDIWIGSLVNNDGVSGMGTLWVFKSSSSEFENGHPFMHKVVITSLIFGELWFTFRFPSQYWLQRRTLWSMPCKTCLRVAGLPTSPLRWRNYQGAQTRTCKLLLSSRS